MYSCLPAGRLFQAISEQLDGKNKTLVDLYNEIDEDQNGKLSFNELCLLLISLDVSVPEAQVRAMFAYLDADGDGDVDGVINLRDLEKVHLTRTCA